MNSGTIGSWSSQRLESFVVSVFCFATSRVDFHWSRSEVAVAFWKWAKLPVLTASSPEGTNVLRCMLLKKNPNGDAVAAVCHISVTCFVLVAFGYQSPQPGSSFTLASIPMSFRFFVMIWSEATQSDQPAIT